MDKVTAMIYGELMATVLKKVKPVPANCVWIAAIAKECKFILVTTDKHFPEMEGINVQYW